MGDLASPQTSHAKCLLPDAVAFLSAEQNGNKMQPFTDKPTVQSKCISLRYVHTLNDMQKTRYYSKESKLEMKTFSIRDFRWGSVDKTDSAIAEKQLTLCDFYLSSSLA